MPKVPLLIISGPIGVGKTSAAEEVSNVLDRRGIAHTLIDLDGLAGTYPRPTNDRFGNALALKNLAALWTNCANAGSRNVVLARVIETERDRDAIAAAIPGAEPIVCQLTANDKTLIARVRKREIGSGCEWHEKRSLELAQSLMSAPADFRMATDHRNLVEIAAEISTYIEWAWAIDDEF